MTNPGGTSQPWRRRVRALIALWPTAALSSLLWVLLWGDLSWANVLSGIALGALIGVAFPLPPFGTATTVRPLAVLRLGGRFLSDLFLASFQVAWSALRPGPTPVGGLVTVQLRTTFDLFVSTVAGLSSMVPGTLVIDHDPPSSTLRLHVLNLETSGGAEVVRRSTLDLEARVLRAFAAHDELVRTGLVGTLDPPAPASSKEGQQ